MPPAEQSPRWHSCAASSCRAARIALIDHHRHSPLDDAAAHWVALLFPLFIVADPTPLRLQIAKRSCEGFDRRMDLLLCLPVLQERTGRFDLSFPQPVPKPLELLTNPFLISL